MKGLTASSFNELFTTSKFTKNLKSLHVKESPGLTDNALKIFSKNTKCSLKELIIQGNEKIAKDKLITPLGIRYILLSPICNELEHIELTTLGLDENIIKYSSQSKDMTNIRTINLDNNF